MADLFSNTFVSTVAGVTRIAPSPTGGLHLGNARTFLANWALARQRNWKIVLRIDDLDSPRVKDGADQEAIEILQWLGVDWDEGPIWETDSIKQYHEILVQLAAQGQIYPCRCTRSQIAAASLSAPHADEHELRYPGTCRPAEATRLDFEKESSQGVAWRLRVANREVAFHDQFSGEHTWNVQHHVGDFLVTNKQGIASYQLAVVVDDFLAGVNQVVRGDDLISSTPRQILLRSLLSLAECRYWHLPIVVGSNGQRLAKRHGGWTIAQYRDAGVSSDRVRGLVAHWSGFAPLQNLSREEFCKDFDIEKLPQSRVVFDEGHHHWLLSK